MEISEVNQSEPVVVEKGNKKILSMKGGFVFGLMLFLVICLMGALTYYVLKDNGIDLLSSFTKTTEEENTDTEDTTADTATYEDKELIGEDDAYAVYVYDKTAGTITDSVLDNVSGSLVVFDKAESIYIPIAGTFTFAGTIIVEDEVGKYIYLTDGMGSPRDTYAISLTEKKMVGESFCSISSYFIGDVIVFTTCDTFNNRPWDYGSGISMFDLISGRIYVFLDSDALNEYSITSVDGNIITYVHRSVTENNNWEQEELITSSTETYTLE